MNIIEITKYSEEILSALNELLPQLSSSAPPLTDVTLLRIIQSESSHLLMAEEGGQFYGSLTLVVFDIPTGTRAWIEDVVVSKDSRGKGVGKLISERAVSLAHELGAKTIDLTSRPSRVIANNLYKKIGFVQRETNIYRFENT
ncbi:MAG: ribosomal protein S18 acetylase RimI-like enzyme [Arenicella sp.]|jgi:ribosomal protein S18 acetylase RimI-like enzyme